MTPDEFDHHLLNLTTLLLPLVLLVCQFVSSAFLILQSDTIIWRMKTFITFIRNSDMARCASAIIVSLLVTSATFLPLLLQGAQGSPVPVPAAQPLPQPQPQPQPFPSPQAHGRPPVSGYYPEPEPCHGNCSWIHDPSILYEDGLYWRFSTSGNIAVATAPSLSGPWEYRGALLHNGTKIFLREDQDIWVELSFFLHRSRPAIPHS